MRVTLNWDYSSQIWNKIKFVSHECGYPDTKFHQNTLKFGEETLENDN